MVFEQDSCRRHETSWDICALGNKVTLACAWWRLTDRKKESSHWFILWLFFLLLSEHLQAICKTPSWLWGIRHQAHSHMVDSHIKCNLLIVCMCVQWVMGFFGCAVWQFRQASSLACSLSFSLSFSLFVLLSLSLSPHRASALRRKLELCPVPPEYHSHTALQRTSLDKHVYKRTCILQTIWKKKRRKRRRKSTLQVSKWDCWEADSSNTKTPIRGTKLHYRSSEITHFQENRAVVLTICVATCLSEAYYHSQVLLMASFHSFLSFFCVSMLLSVN